MLRVGLTGAIATGKSTVGAMLRELGCFADYTFSSIFVESQPSSVNNIFEATDDDGNRAATTILLPHQY